MHSLFTPTWFDTSLSLSFDHSTQNKPETTNRSADKKPSRPKNDEDDLVAAPKDEDHELIEQLVANWLCGLPSFPESP